MLSRNIYNNKNIYVTQLLVFANHEHVIILKNYKYYYNYKKLKKEIM